MATSSVNGNTFISTSDISSSGTSEVILQLSGQTGIAGTPTDIMLVLDNSASMNGQPLIDLKAGANAFVDIIDEATDGLLDGIIAHGSRIGVIIFDGNAHEVQPLTYNVNQVHSVINSIATGSGTDIEGAFRFAHAELTKSNPDSKKILIIFTDGDKSQGGSPDDDAAAARAAGIEIFAIGLGYVILGSLLNKWATEPASEHVIIAPNSSELKQFIQDIGAAITIPAGTNIQVVFEVNSHFSVSNLNAGKGIISQLGNTITWNIEELQTETVALTYAVTHDNTKCGGVEFINDYISYNDSEGHIVNFPNTLVNVRGCAALLELEPVFSANTVGTTHTVVATVRDDFGNSVSQVLVNFRVSGGTSDVDGVPSNPIPANGSGFTDGNGQVPFSYSNNKASNDTITATVPLQSNVCTELSKTAVNEWEPIQQGTWTVVFDSERSGLEWGVIGWNGTIYNDSVIEVSIASSEDNINFSALQTVTNQSALFVPYGRYLKIIVTLKCSSDGKSPLLTDITIGAKHYNFPAVVNNAPLVEAGPDSETIVHQQLELHGEVTDDCLPDGKPINIVWSKESGPGEVTFSPFRGPAWLKASFEVTGDYVLRLTASDSGSVGSDTKRVVVTPKNLPPVVNAGPDQDILISNEVMLIGTVTDDGISSTDLGIIWSKVSGPGDVVFADPKQPVTSVSFSEIGEYVLRLSASDSLLSSSDDVFIHVDAVHRTYTTDADFDEGTKINVSSIVPNQLQLGLYNSREMIEDILASTPKQGTWTVVFDSGQSGLKWGLIGWNGTIYNDGAIKVSVASSEDGSNFSATQNVNNQSDLIVPAGRYFKIIVVFERSSDGKSPILTDITVGSRGYQLPPAENHAPLVQAGSDLNKYIDLQLELRGEVSDDCLPDGMPLTIAWSKESGPGEVIFDESNGPAWVKASFGQTGDYVLRLTASDSSSSSSDTMRAFVFPRPPVVDAGPDQDILLSDEATLNGTVTVGGIPSTGLDIMWSKVSGPGNVIFADPKQTVTSVSFSKTGKYILRLRASDSRYSSSDDVIINVNVVYRTYTSDADFNEGTKINLSSIIPDHLQLDDTAQQQNFIWVAVSTKGTIVKINTDTCEIMGEYWTSPEGQPKDPSRTTVDLNGNVWATNRAGNSVVCIGLAENNQWIDKNGHNACDTSTGFGDIKPWTNAGNADTNGGVSTAVDECILHYTRVSSPGTRHVSVDRDNNIWVSGTGNRIFDLIDGNTGEIIRTEGPAKSGNVLYGGYGGLIDPNGVIWSANPLLRWDTSKPLTGPNGVNWKGYNHDSYGLAIDSRGNVWNTSMRGDHIYKFAPDGTLIGVYSHGSDWAQGCVVDNNDDVWVAHSREGGNHTVGHIKNDGTYVGNVEVGNGPTGVAVDSNGKIWATNYLDGTVSRIDPNKGQIGDDGVTPVGEVDFTSQYLGGYLYNYSDMTGSTLVGAPEQGSWEVVLDSKWSGLKWGLIGWNGTIFNDGSIKVSVASSEDGSNFSAIQIVNNQSDLNVPAGRYLKMIVTLKRSSDGKSPILTDITVGSKGYLLPLAENHAPSVEAGPDTAILMDQQLELRGEVSDDCLPDGMPLNISWNKESGPGKVTFDDTNGPVWVKAFFEVVGEYELKLTASDSAFVSNDTMRVTVAIENLPPVVNAGPDQDIVLPDAVVLNGSVTDDGIPGTGLDITWSKVSGPGDVVFANPELPVTTASFSITGEYVLRLRASDSLLSGSDDVTIRVDAVHRTYTTDADFNEGTKVNLSSIVPDQLQLDDSGTVVPKQGTWTVVFDSGHSGLEWGVIGWKGTVYNDGLIGVNVAISEDGNIFSNLLNVSNQNDFSVPAGRYLKIIISLNRSSDGKSPILTDITVGAKVYQLPPAENHAPAVEAGPDAEITIDQQLELRGEVSDDCLPDGLPLNIEWTMESGPGLVTFDHTNGPAWVKASFGQTGDYVLRLTAQDSAFVSMDSMHVTVAPTSPQADYERPIVLLYVVPAQVNVGEIVNITVNASDNVGVVSKALKINGIPVELNDLGQATYISSEPGVFKVEASALDAAGNEGKASGEFMVITSWDIVPPVVGFSLPDEDAILYLPTIIQGTATDDNLVNYKLEYSEKDRNQFIEFASGSLPVINSELGIFDPTMLRNGLFDVRLTAVDASGNTTSVIRIYEVEGQAKIGNFSISFNDLTVPVSGMPISIIRTYDSRNLLKGDFGTGWTIDIQDIRLSESCVPGENWVLNRAGGGLSYYLTETKAHIITVTYPDGKIEKFQMVPGTVNIYGETTISFSPLPNTFSSLVALPEQENDCLVSSTNIGPVEIVDYSFLTYNPNRYKLTQKDGTVLIINQSTGLESITDTNGNQITFGSSGITHSSGKSVTFERDSQGRITTISDLIGNKIRYSYDYYGDLVAVTNQIGETTRFTYNSRHQIIDIVSPTGMVPVRNLYDDEGRLVAQIDPDGNRIEYTHNISTRQEIVTDRLGNQTVIFYDERGNVVSKTDPMGYTTTYTYDLQDNLLSETDALNNTKTYTYDSYNNKTSETNALGYKTEYTFDSMGNVLTIKDPLGNITINTYDANGKLTLTKDPLGNETGYEYDFSGNLKSETNPLGDTKNYTYDGCGNMTSSTDYSGNITTYTYDENGNQLSQTTFRTTSSDTESITTRKIYDGLNRVIEAIDPYGYSSKTEFNSIGKKAADVDALGNRTEYQYDDFGNLIQTRYIDGSKEIKTYDLEGNVRSSTDPENRTTYFEYDKDKRLILTTYPDRKSISLEYDEVGNKIKDIDERGFATTYAYDAAYRNTSVTSALGNTTLYKYDGNNNNYKKTDANGYVTSYRFDANNRKTKIIFNDNTEISILYDSLRRVVQEIDQAGNVTKYDYDSDGNLINVTDALGCVTRYSYDEVGNQISQVDANGHETKYEYDKVGNCVKRKLPLGMFETFEYDSKGRMLVHTDFNGSKANYEYDVKDRKIKEISPNGREEIYTYTKNGQRNTVTDLQGTTAYEYDLRDRLIKQTNPDGTVISYTYDEVGNRTGVTIPSGTTSYEYDQLNRLTKVTGSDGGNTVYAYDAVGNRASVVIPSGIVMEYTYDTLNRLKKLVNKNCNGDVISSYEYILGPSGNRLKVTESSGRMIDFSYDSAFKLTEEKITDTVLGNRIINYSYDTVGNRLIKVDNGITTNYNYDENDRLLSEGDSTYTYDNNGNTISKITPGATINYSYDYRNRLINLCANNSDGQSASVEYMYNSDGIRIQKKAGNDVSKYLVDENRDYAHVLEERDSGGNLTVSYVYGVDLISQTRSVDVSYYLHDGNMSTRSLIDGAGNQTDTYTYDAFGVMIGRIGNTVNEYLYTGEQYDANVGFYYLRARYMNPVIGRFITIDEYEGNIFEPLSLHKYLYAKANPMYYIDPSGRITVTVVEIVFWVAIVIVFLSILWYNWPKKQNKTLTPVTPVTPVTPKLRKYSRWDESPWDYLIRQLREPGDYAPYEEGRTIYED